MPSEQQRLGVVGQRSTSSVHSQPNSPSTSPATHTSKKTQKHVVGGGSRIHTRVPSSKGLHKLTKGHGNEGSHTDLKKLTKGASTTTLKKNSSHVSLKRNRSAADVKNRPKSSNGQKGLASVHFEIGDQEDAWEEASSSASPALSRSASRTASHSASGKSSTNNSRPQSPIATTSKPQGSANGANANESVRHIADGRIITEKLLKRTASHNTTKMSLATATPITPAGHSPDSLHKSQNTLSGSKEEIVSRFVGSSGTPSDGAASPYPIRTKHESNGNNEEVKRAKSMGNLVRRDTEDDDSALAPRSRKSSTSHAYIPPQQSRTQQKLWLQRASSNIEPQQMTAPALNGLGLHHSGLGMGVPSLVGAGYDGRDPRIKVQLERTGLEYLVVRRHQDPVGKAVRRLEQIPGREKWRRIPKGQGRRDGRESRDGGLSQSLRSERRAGREPTTARSSFERSGDEDERDLSNTDDGVNTILRGLWEKSFDLSASA
ncbi:hypothetical protein B0O99DRAFT_608213, partial [Bisporella sp. PMI_857]